MTHTIKLNYRFAEPVLFGEKRFEVRNNDRAYQKGDHVKFKVVDVPEFNGNSEAGRKAAAHTITILKHLEENEYEITFVLSGWGIESGYVVFGIEEVEQ